MKLTINCDGGARGNPGPAGIGFIIQNAKCKSQNDNANCKIFEKGQFIGEATNNQAEYRAVIEALEWAKEKIKPTSTYGVEGKAEIEALKWVSNQVKPIPGMGAKGLEIECLLDSELVVEQLNQRYKIKNEGLKPLFWQIRDLVMALGGKITFKYIPREQNKEADRLVNKALDEAIK